MTGFLVIGAALAGCADGAFRAVGRADRLAEDTMQMMHDAAAVLRKCAVDYAVAHRVSALSPSELADASLSACQAHAVDVEHNAALAFEYSGASDPAGALAVEFARSQRRDAELAAHNAVLRALADSHRTP